VSLWFSTDTLVSSTNKNDRHDITKILLKVVLSTITLTHLFVFSGSIDYKDVVNQTLMEVLLKIRDSVDNPVLKLRAASPHKPGSSPKTYVNSRQKF